MGDESWAGVPRQARPTGAIDGFALVASEPVPGVREIRVWGEMDTPEADRLRQVLDRGGRDVIIDLEDCEFLESAGLEIILRAHHRAAKHGHRVIVFGAHGQARRLFAVGGGARLGIVVRRRQEALLALDGAA